MAQEKESASWKDTVQRNDEVDAQIAETEKTLAMMEAELETAEARVEAAEARVERVRKQLKREAAAGASPGAPTTPAATSTPAGAKVVEGVEEVIPEDEEVVKAPTHRASKETKNSSARSDKEVSRDKWVAARAAESRVKERTTKARECLRRLARDRKFDLAKPEVNTEVEVVAAPAPVKEPEKQEPSVDAAKLLEGAKGIAERLKCLNERPNAAEKRTALMRVVTAGRENFYTFEPPQVIQDLQERELVSPSLAADLLSLLKEDPAPAKPVSASAEGWLEPAKVASTFERLDDKPFKEAELLYLRKVEEKDLASAEAELEAAETQLSTLVSQAEACFSQLPSDSVEEPEPVVPAVGAELEVDEDEAERWEAQNDPQRESRGSKNTSALPPKVVSKEKWLAARGEESRAREEERKVRDARRAEARDWKVGAADIGED
mmetsp:Transcript_13554/g.31883  ORF Transcript_13554/g.31883 Transcript_13554/m.31883 type:complete len:437 (+) Transcript_13554:61-1371(+)